MQKQLQQFLKWGIISCPRLLCILAVPQQHLMQSSAFLHLGFHSPVPSASSSVIVCECGSPQAFPSARKDRTKSIKTTEKYPNTGSLNDLHPTCSGWRAVGFQDGKLYWALISILHIYYSQNWHPNQACATERQMNVWQHSPFQRCTEILKETVAIQYSLTHVFTQAETFFDSTRTDCFIISLGKQVDSPSKMPFPESGV